MRGIVDNCQEHGQVLNWRTGRRGMPQDHTSSLNSYRAPLTLRVYGHAAMHVEHEAPFRTQKE